MKRAAPLGEETLSKPKATKKLKESPRTAYMKKIKKETRFKFKYKIEFNDFSLDTKEAPPSDYENSPLQIKEFSDIPSKQIMSQDVGMSSKIRFGFNDGLDHLRDELEQYGMKQNKSMNKNLLTRLHHELQDYLTEGKLP